MNRRRNIQSGLLCYMFDGFQKKILRVSVFLIGFASLLYLYRYNSQLNHFEADVLETTLVSTLSPSQYTVVEMQDRSPFFKLATTNGQKPIVDGDVAQQKIVDYLDLFTVCQKDPSTTVIDVGGFLGEFGLYAGACGCQVFIFEVLPHMASLIRTSIALNNFSTSRVQVSPRAVNDLPTNSNLRFLNQGGQTTISNGNVSTRTIRLDDLPIPVNSKILLMKIDVEGYEFNVIRSAMKLFESKRIEHLIFEYTAWWTDRAPQKDLIPFIKNELKPKHIYTLHRRKPIVYGPLSQAALDNFHEYHVKTHLQTDIYLDFVKNRTDDKTLQVEPYVFGSSFA